VKFQMGVASYNALYSGFGAIPIFLVWLYLSWMIVLIGAQLAASHQYEQHLKQAVRARHVDQELRETLAIAIAADVTRRFLQGCQPRTQTALAEALEVPPPSVEEVVNALVKASILVRAVCGHEIGYMPARDVDDLRVADVREAVRRDPAADELKAVLDRHLDPAVRDLMQITQLASRKGPNDLTLRELAERTVRRGARAGIRVTAAQTRSWTASSPTCPLEAVSAPDATDANKVGAPRCTPLFEWVGRVVVARCAVPVPVNVGARYRGDFRE
jgi:membrane protein